MAKCQLKLLRPLGEVEQHRLREKHATAAAAAAVVATASQPLMLPLLLPPLLLLLCALKINIEHNTVHTLKVCTVLCSMFILSAFIWHPLVFAVRRDGEHRLLQIPPGTPDIPDDPAVCGPELPLGDDELVRPGLNTAAGTAGLAHVTYHGPMLCSMQS